MKRIVIICAVLAALICTGFATGFIMTPSQYYRTYPDTSLCENTPRVCLTIEFTEVADKGGALPVSESGVMISGEYALTEGDSVFDVLSRVLRYEDIPFGYSGGKNVYISSVGGLAEFDYGASSGWIYLINGKAPDINCAQYFPENGDEIVLRYVDTYYKGGGSE